MLYKNILQNRDSYIDFHTLYFHVKSSIYLDFMDNEELADSMVNHLFKIAKSSLFACHSSGEHWFNYFDAEKCFLFELENYFQITVDAVIYDGSINSTVLHYGDN